MKIIPRFLLLAGLALGANAASAIPLQVNVETLGLAAGEEWELTGPTPADGYWGGIILGSQSWDLDINPGSYLWEIDGGGVLASVKWSLILAGNLIDSGSNGGLWFKVNDDKTFEAVSVPEPVTLALMGFGLAAIGFTSRRKSRRGLIRPI